MFAPVLTMTAEGDCVPPLIVYDIDPVTGTKTRKLDEHGIRSLENMLPD